MADAFSSAGYPAANMPESVKARIAAARALQAAAAQSSGPYTSGAVTALKGIEGLMGGLSERQAINEGMAGQAAQRQMMAQLLMNGAPNVGPAAAQAAGTGARMGIPTSAAASGASGINWDRGGPQNDAKRATLMNYAVGNLGLSPTSAAALIGHADAESNFRPGVFNPTGERSHGLFQWNEDAGRWSPFLQWAQANGRSSTDPFAQLDYAKVESSRMRGANGQSVWDNLARAPDLSTASRAWMDGFEQPKVRDYGNRIGLGNAALAAYQNAGGQQPAQTMQAAAPPSPSIGDAAALAAETRVRSGQGTPADRALLVTYRQQQNAPPPGRSAAADLPAPNAQPVASNALPPGVTPDMVSAPQPSPFGGPPQPMQPQPAGNAAMAAVLRGAAPGAQPPSPFGAMPASMAPRPPAGPQPTSVLGGDIQGAPDALSSNGLKLGIMGPNGVDPTIAGQFQAGIQANAQPASGLSTSRNPGFDNLPAGGGVVPSDIGDGGYQGGTRGMQAAINGALPDPGAAPTAPAMPSTLPIFAQAASTPPAAVQQIAQDLGPPAPAPQQTADASLPQAGPMPPVQGAQSAAPGQPLGTNPDAPAPNAISASLNVPASVMAQVLRGPQPNGLPGDGGGDPSSARAFLTQQAQGAAPSAMAQALRQQPPAPAPQGGGGGGFDLGSLFGGLTGGGAQGQGGGNPLSGLMGGGQGGNPLASIPLIGGVFGGGQGGGTTGTNPFSAAPSASSAPAGSAAFGGQGQAQPFAPGGQGGSAPVPGMGNMNQAQVMALLSNPYTTPQEAELIMNRLAPQPMKLSAGEGLVGRRQDGTYGELYTQAPKAEWTFNADTGRITNSATGEQRQVNAPIEHFETNREGLTTNTRTGQVTPNPGASYRFMTQAEKQAAGIPLDQPMQVGPNGEMHAATGQTINVGGEQNVYDTGMAKTLLENHQSLMQGVDANRTKLRDLNLMSGALQRLQQNGGTTGMGAEEKLHLQSAINTAAGTLGLGQQFQVDDPEVIGKIQRQISGAAAKDIGGARTTNFDMEQMLQANPGLGLSPTGNQRMLGIAQQVTQRNIDVGQAMQDAAASAVQQGRRVNPVDMEAIRQSYDQQHHIVDPITGQDLSASAKLPEFQRQGSAASPSSPSGAAPGPNLPTPTSMPPVFTPDQARAAPRGTVYMTQDGRRMMR